MKPSSLPPRPRIQRRPVHGVLLLDKPLGLSSNDALQKAKRLYRAEKAGHTGTLDPLATGLLPLCFGAATKFSQVSLDADKRYTATLQLGATTTTADAEGEVIESRPVQLPDGTPITRADVEAACSKFVGKINQLPPMYSALKRDGKPLYEYARAGIEVDREARAVVIHSIIVLDGAPDGSRVGAASAAIAPSPRQPPMPRHETPVGAASAAITPSPRQPTLPGHEIAAEAAPTTANAKTSPDTQYTLDILCSKGTYIRTLAEDIGKALGCGAHLAALRRTETGPLMLANALTLEQLDSMDEAARDAALLPADMLLADWPVVRLAPEDAARFLNGVRRRLPLPDAPRVRVYGPEQYAFLGSGHVSAGELISDRLLSPIEVQGLLDQAR